MVTHSLWFIGNYGNCFNGYLKHNVFCLKNISSLKIISNLCCLKNSQKVLNDSKLDLEFKYISVAQSSYAHGKNQYVNGNDNDKNNKSCNANSKVI